MKLVCAITYGAIKLPLARLVWKQLQIDTDMLLIITITSDRLFNDVNMDYLEYAVLHRFWWKGVAILPCGARDTSLF